MNKQFAAMRFTELSAEIKKLKTDLAQFGNGTKGAGKPKKRCRHNNLYVTEEGTEYIYTTIRDGVAVTLDHESDATGWYRIQCEDCGHNKRYNIHSKWTPKWVIAAVELI